MQQRTYSVNPVLGSGLHRLVPAVAGLPCSPRLLQYRPDVMPQCGHSMSISPTVSPIMSAVVPHGTKAEAGSDGGNGHENDKLRVALSSKNHILPAIDARGAVSARRPYLTTLRHYHGSRYTTRKRGQCVEFYPHECYILLFREPFANGSWNEKWERYVLRNWLQSLIEAWGMLITIPLPSKLEFELDTDPERTVACFPLVGAVIGFCAYLLASLCFLLIASDILAAATATILITLGAEFISENGEVSLLASVLNLKLKGVPVSEIKELPDTRINYDSSSSLLVFISIYLLKLVCVGLLVFYSKSSWLIASFALGYLMRAKLAVEGQTRDSRAIIEVDDPKHTMNLCWLTAGCAVLIGGLTSFPAPLLILILAYLLFMGFDKLLERSVIEVNERLIDIYGAAADLFFLLLIASLMAGGHG